MDVNIHYCSHILLLHASHTRMFSNLPLWNLAKGCKYKCVRVCNTANVRVESFIGHTNARIAPNMFGIGDALGFLGVRRGQIKSKRPYAGHLSACAEFIEFIKTPKRQRNAYINVLRARHRSLTQGLCVECFYNRTIHR